MYTCIISYIISNILLFLYFHSPSEFCVGVFVVFVEQKSKEHKNTHSHEDKAKQHLKKNKQITYRNCDLWMDFSLFLIYRLLLSHTQWGEKLYFIGNSFDNCSRVFHSMCAMHHSASSFCLAIDFVSNNCRCPFISSFLRSSCSFCLLSIVWKVFITANLTKREKRTTVQHWIPFRTYLLLFMQRTSFCRSLLSTLYNNWFDTY